MSHQSLLICSMWEGDSVVPVPLRLAPDVVGAYSNRTVSLHLGTKVLRYMDGIRGAYSYE